MKFKLKFDCDNAAFKDDSAPDDERDDNAALERECADIIYRLAKRGVTVDGEGAVFDTNGNRVGKWSLK